VVEPSFGHVSRVNGEKLDDEEFVVPPAHPAPEAVVLQPNAGIAFAIIFDNVVGRPKTLREAHVMHIAPKCFRPWHLGAKAVPFSITVLATTQVVCTMLSACPFTPPHAEWRAGEDTVPAVGCSIAVLSRLALEQSGLETETSAHR
jgi:hypothetical protein